MEKSLIFLNEKQQKAVKHIDGPCLVIAGPGSGKTRVISHRIYNLIYNEKILPNKILAITFTKAASNEMQERTIKLCSDFRINKVNFATFHSFFFGIIRYFCGYKLDSILDEKSKINSLAGIMKSLNMEDANDSDILIQLINEISYVKNELIDIKDFNSNTVSNDNFIKIYEYYETYKEQIKKIDFDDMLIKTFELLTKKNEVLSIVRQKYKYILIDEFQDVNKVQFEIIRLICKPVNNIFAVGDEDQSIYGFRGSRPDFMIKFNNYFNNAVKIVLDINYRSNKEIIDISNKLILNNKFRHEKKLISKKGQGGQIKFIRPKNIDEEASFIIQEIVKEVKGDNTSFDDYAIIYRNNEQSRPYVDLLINEGIEFRVKDLQATIYDHWACRDIISYLKICIGSNTNEDWFRIINKPFRYLSRDSINKAKNEDNFLDYLITNCELHDRQIKTLMDLDVDLNYIRSLSPHYAISYIRETIDYDRFILDYCINRKIEVELVQNILKDFENSSGNYKKIQEFLDHIELVKMELNKKNKKNNKGIMLTTMHGSKGLEFDYVYIVGLDDKTIPYSQRTEIKKDEEYHIEEERRLMYVAISRAKKRICISAPKLKYGKKINISQFVHEIIK